MDAAEVAAAKTEESEILTVNQLESAIQRIELSNAQALAAIQNQLEQILNKLTNG